MVEMAALCCNKQSGRRLLLAVESEIEAFGLEEAACGGDAFGRGLGGS